MTALREKVSKEEHFKKVKTKGPSGGRFWFHEWPFGGATGGLSLALRHLGSGGADG